MPKQIEAKTILNKKKRRDDWFLDDYTLNPYSACSFNCLFCYIRGSKYGEHMEDKLAVKINAPQLLEKKLSLHARKGRHGIIVLASATEAWQKAEEKYKVTRECLEIILKYKFPVHIITKSKLVLRDLDLIQEIDKHAILPEDIRDRVDRGAIVSFSFTTLDDSIARIFEPGATAPSKRLETMKIVRETGLLTGASLMPLLPWISDKGEDLEAYFRIFKELNADYILPASLSLFGDGKADSKTLVLKAVEAHYPDLLPRYEQYFSHSTRMPDYYHKAFYKKMDALFKKYNLKNRIESRS